MKRKKREKKKRRKKRKKKEKKKKKRKEKKRKCENPGYRNQPNLHRFAIRLECGME